MKLQVLAVGGKMPGWVQAGWEEYRKRLPRELGLSLRELPLARRGKNTPAAQAIDKEAEQLLMALDNGDWVVALDGRGSQWSTEQLAQQLDGWRAGGRPVKLLIGGPDGLSENCRQRANQLWSLSNLTLPHPLVRVILAEQLYRAWSVLQNHPYHK